MACYRVHPIHRSPRSGLSRRDFLTVGAVAGLGLNLGDFFAIQRAQAEQKHYDFLEPTEAAVRIEREPIVVIRPLVPEHDADVLALGRRGGDVDSEPVVTEADTGHEVGVGAKVIGAVQ